MWKYTRFAPPSLASRAKYNCISIIFLPYIYFISIIFLFISISIYIHFIRYIHLYP